MIKNPHVKKAIELAGSQRALAALCGQDLRQQHVHKWLGMQQLPVERALQIHLATNGAVPLRETRPDFVAALEAAGFISRERERPSP